MNIFANYQAITRDYCRARGLPVPAPTGDCAAEVAAIEQTNMALSRAARGKPSTVYVDPMHDRIAASLMAEWMRQDAHDRACGKHYRITHKARAFQGVSAQEVREVGGA